MTEDITEPEQAYQLIANDLLAFPNGRTWLSISGRYQVFSKMVSSTWWLVDEEGGIDRKWGGGSDEYNRSATRAALFLRHWILRTTGDRIWALTFTFYPTGKFRIEYDYNKPDGYEETDETISGDEINDSLARLAGKDDASS